MWEELEVELGGCGCADTLLATSQSFDEPAPTMVLYWRAFPDSVSRACLGLPSNGARTWAITARQPCLSASHSRPPLTLP